ncbi:MAG: ribbon-helix-helix protein, CopG family [Deferrisomatales bacterium]|nr:ribbon-helix-helix protein, CopG family [Deferrisomatales bacterium]
MVRTQIYITEREQQGLRGLAKTTGKSQSELIRVAIDRFLAAALPGERRALLRQGRGLWKEREDLPDFGELRRSWDRP